MPNRISASYLGLRTLHGVVNTQTCMGAMERNKVEVSRAGALICVTHSRSYLEAEKHWFLRADDAVAYIVSLQLDNSPVEGAKEALKRLE